ncbi:MAG: trypsin-like serine protease [Myxococcota bacterium]
MPRRVLSSSVLSRVARALVGSVASLLFAGCSAPSGESVEGVGQAVLNGQLSGPDEDSVVKVISKGDRVTHTCTGTLLAPNIVITARHCVANFEDLPFTCTADGELAPGSQGGKMGTLLPPANITIRVGTTTPSSGSVAAGKKVFATQATSICRNDIAVVVLDTELNDLPISPVRLGAGNQIGERLRVVGYGVDEKGSFGTRHTRSGLTIAQIGSSQFRPNGDSVPPRTFVTEGPALCIGDSGGPAFTTLDAVTGVWSQVVGDCDAETARNYFTEVAPFENELITPAFEEAGKLPWLEGTRGPGDPSSGGSASAGAPGEGGTAGDGAGGEAMGGVGIGGSGGMSGGSVATGGTTASGGLNATGGMEIRGPRKKGGCTCNMPGASEREATWLVAPLLAASLLLRRRKARSPRAV